jgi:transposase
MVAADARTAITFALSPGNAHDAPEGRELLRDLGSFPGMPVIMDRAYEGNETRQLVLALDMLPVVPPKCNRVDPWRYDRALYKKRNEIERLFRPLKGYRRIFSRVEKLGLCVPCVSLLRSHRRSTQVVLTRPRSLCRVYRRLERVG